MKKSRITGIILKVIALLGVLFYFIPVYTVSCSGKDVNISPFKTTIGIKILGEPVVKPQIGSVLLFILPIVLFVVLIIKAKNSKGRVIMAIVNLTVTIVYEFVWIIYAAKVNSKAKESLCTADAKFTFYLLVILLVIQCIATIIYMLNAVLPHTVYEYMIALIKYSLEGQQVQADQQSQQAQALQVAQAIQVAQPAQEATRPVTQQTATTERTISISKSLIKKIAIIAGIVVALATATIITVVVIVKNKDDRKVIDVDKYITYKIEGYSGYATLQAGRTSSYLDELTKDDKKNDNSNSLGDLFSSSTICSDIRNCIEYEVDKTEKIANGDRITIDLKVDSSKLTELGYKINKEKIVINVKDLKEVETVNPFNHLKVTYSGIAPTTTVEFEKVYDEDDELFKYMSYSNSNTKIWSKYANGEEITITMSDSFINKALSKGIKLEPVSHTYVVNNEKKLVTTKEEVAEEKIVTIKAKAKEVFDKEVASWGEYVIGSDAQYEGGFISTDEDGEGNDFVLIYSMNVVSDKYKINDRIYFGIEFSDTYTENDVVISEDKTITFVTDEAYYGDWFSSKRIAGSPSKDKLDIIEDYRKYYAKPTIVKFGNVENW